MKIHNYFTRWLRCKSYENRRLLDKRNWSPNPTPKSSVAQKQIVLKDRKLAFHEFQWDSVVILLLQCFFGLE